MKWFVLPAFCLICLQFCAQTFTTWGTDFWLPNIGGYISVETRQAAVITINDPSPGPDITVNCAANSIENIDLTSQSQYTVIDGYFNQNVQEAIHITSDVPVNIRYAYGNWSVDGGLSTLLPTAISGTSYTLSTHHIEDFYATYFSHNTPIILITATEDNTVIDLNLTHVTENGFPINTPFSITLNQGEVIPIRSPFCNLDNMQGNPATSCLTPAGDAVTNDFSGSTVSVRGSCKPISVHLYTGGYISFGYTPGGCCSDRLLLNYLPDNYWGTEFYVVPEQHVAHGNLVKIFSKFDNNTVSINGMQVAMLDANETLDTLLFNAVYVNTAKQSFVTKYLLSAQSNPALLQNQITDPEITCILPINYQTQKGRFDFYSMAYDPGSLFWLNVIAKTEDIPFIYFDGQPLSPANFTPFQSYEDYSWAYFPIAEAAHELEGDGVSFQAITYGNILAGSRVSYLGIDTIVSNDDPCGLNAQSLVNGTLTLHASDSNEALLWSTGATTASITVTENGVYEVHGTDSCGKETFRQYFFVSDETCEVNELPQDFSAAACLEQITFPNVFTPDGNQINEMLTLTVPGCFQSFEWTIVNRWGEQVFSTNDVNFGWDGTIHGEPATEGVYFWKFEGEFTEGKAIQRAGFLTVIRK
ncbi:MAG: gliding motility-associated C-terminal domain-containing protein [Bacteroidota bacterium]